ncbi:MAG TPA: DHA2 family efflux MFS transporter permease subunit [Sporichthyaceae bacterium]|jgi:EmrB/QacA subfamily drug resistance transporter|nr:DHA2 family efflux MFS transporter permease subunit [Sporichthyaceae bacterium]
MCSRPAAAFGDAAAGLVLHSARGRLALAATVAASGMASLDATVVNVAVPHIGQDLHADVSALQWVLTGYLLALASLILLGGALGDRFGRRRVFVVGAIAFAGASALCGLAPSVGWLITARVLQGIGGALLTPGSLAIIQSIFRPADRATAVGAWSGLSGVAGALGPLLGGLIVDGPGWRWAFLLNIPVAGFVVVGAHAAIPETRDQQGGRPVDLRGTGWAVVALATATWALTEAGPRGWLDGGVLSAAGVGLAASAAFVRHVRRAGDPLVPPAMFADRDFTVLNIGTFFLYTSIGLTFFLVAYQLQAAAGWSALRAGLALLPVTVLMLLFSGRSGSLAEQVGLRWQLALGPLAAAGGLLLLTRVGTHPTWSTDVAPGAILLGLGLTTFVAPLTAGVMAAAGAERAGVASGLNNGIARTASLTGLAVVPVVSGLAAAHGSAQLTHAYRVALVIAAAVAAVATPMFVLGLRREPARSPLSTPKN